VEGTGGTGGAGGAGGAGGTSPTDTEAAVPFTTRKKKIAIVRNCNLFFLHSEAIIIRSPHR